MLAGTIVGGLAAGQLWADGAPSPAAESARVRSGLVALYTFDASEGETVYDRSGTQPALDLRIENPSSTVWQDGGLLIQSAARIASKSPARKIVEAVQRSGAATIEVWVTPSSNRQHGPARIVSLSANTQQRNFTLGQEKQSFDLRFRTNKTDRNGLPSLASPKQPAANRLMHVVYTRTADGNARLYVNGERRGAKDIKGSPSNWDANFRLILANEAQGQRPWLGEFHLAAIYGRALSADEVKKNFRAGAAAPTAEVAKNEQHERFETQIAPLLAKNCLQCHDSASKEGGLDLSKREAALAGGDSGEVISPGAADESLLWEYVEAGMMPPEGEPLADDDQRLLSEWIDAGAAWSLEQLDPAIYVHQGRAAENWVRRLTLPEYIETVHSAVGVDIAQEAREVLPPDVRADGFSNTAYNLNVDLKHVDGFSRLAAMIVERMDVSQFAAQFTKKQSLSTDDTMRDFVADMGKWLLRGPLDDREITNYSGIATTVASAGGDFQEAASLIVEAMLQSPRFIYRVERQRGDGTAWPAGDYELASRLSYLAWGSSPDKPLLRAAEAGELQDRSQMERHAQRMLKDPRAIERSLQFATQWLNLNRLDNLQPDAGKFPNWDPVLAADMRAETLAFFEEVVWNQQRPLGDLFNAQFTFATPRLAKHYGLEPKGSGFARYDVSETPARGGLLTQGSVLTVGGDDASMVTRGLFVLHDVLRGTINDPPPGVDTTPLPSKPGLSQRGIAQQRLANQACGGCHERFEPLAFGLEQFDGLGAFHLNDEFGNELRDDGNILFPGDAEPSPFNTSADLMDLLAESERVKETITWKLAQFALGRPLVAGDARTIAEVHQLAQQRGGTYIDVITALATSDLVMTTRTE